ncbi:MAG: hypothetical protein AAF268_15400 [Cyanobacteria bacterium P01_A01_bin.3]
MTHLPSSQLVAVARDFYAAYVASCSPERCRQPLGVVVNRNNSRCGLIFKEQSSLLMHEVFVPVSAIRAGGLTATADVLEETSPTYDWQNTTIEPTVLIR